MTRLLVIPFVALFATTVLADDKKPAGSFAEIAVVKGDKIEAKGGKATEPVKVTSAAELEKAVPDEATRTRLAKLVDFKTHTLLIFAWQGSGQDKLEYTVLQSDPPQVEFTVSPGRTKDLRSHVHLFVVRSDVKWTVK
ncbi:MAG: hypothetical protein ABGY75_02390 [Gemmataceae bacterium]